MNPARSHPDLSPDVFAVLLDVAKQSDSILLSREPARLSRELLAPVEPIRSTASFLSAAERHLVSAHGDELGRYLLRSAQRDIAAHADLGLRMHSRRVGREEFEVSVVEHQNVAPEIRDRTGRTWSTQALLRPESEMARELRRLRSLTVLSMRLTRHPVAPVLLGQIDLFAGELRAAERRFENLRGGGLYGRLAAEHLGAAAAARHDWRRAAALYAEAALGPWATPDAAFWWGINAAQFGDADAVTRAMVRVKELGDFLPQEVNGLLGCVRVASWMPTDTGRRTVAQKGLEGSVFEEVIDAA